MIIKVIMWVKALYGQSYASEANWPDNSLGHGVSAIGKWWLLSLDMRSIPMECHRRYAVLVREWTEFFLIVAFSASFQWANHGRGE